MTLDGGRRKPENFRRVLYGEAGEKAEFDDLALLRMEFGKAVERFVEGEDIQAFCFGSGDGLGKAELEDVTATFASVVAAGVVHKNLPHQARGDTIKMFAVLPFGRLLADQPDKSLMDKSGALESMVRSFETEIMARHGAQFFVHEGHQQIKSVAFPGTPAGEQIGNIGRRIARQNPSPSKGDRASVARIESRSATVNWIEPPSGRHAHKSHEPIRYSDEPVWPAFPHV